MNWTPSPVFLEHVLASGLPQGDYEARLYAADCIDPGGWPEPAQRLFSFLDTLWMEADSDHHRDSLRAIISFVARTFPKVPPTFDNFRPAGPAIPLDAHWSGGTLVATNKEVVWQGEELIESPTHIQVWCDDFPITEFLPCFEPCVTIGPEDTVTLEFPRDGCILSFATTLA